MSSPTPVHRSLPAATVKVSVVIAAYCSGEGLTRVIASLDAQTMPREHYEVIFVDDGSPDDTLERLHAIRASRSNVIVESIPNSGWSSTPRNIGLERAHGEYVLFMDHDDSLFPEALQAGYDFGAPVGADIINPKEVRTGGWSWGWDAYKRDIRGDAPKHPMLVQPMLPHKFYRRAFLMDNAIRFPEGARVLWEDNYFNIEAYARAGCLAVLASVPSYQWHVGHESSSTLTFERDAAEHWSNLDRLFAFFESVLTDEAELTWVQANYYENRVLGPWFGPGMLGRDSSEQAVATGLLPAFVATHVPRAVDEALDPVPRARSALIRAGRLDLLEELAGCDSGVTTIPTLERIQWLADGRLEVVVASWWLDSDGERLILKASGGRVSRIVPDRVGKVLAADLLDVTDAVAEVTGELSLKDRATKATWPVDARSEVLRARREETLCVGVRVHAVIDPDAAFFGHSLRNGVWDVAVRSSAIGYRVHRGVRYSGPSKVALLNGQVAIAYGNKSGLLTLDFGENVKNLLGETAIGPKSATTQRRGLRAFLVSFPLAAVSVHGSTALPCEIVLADTAGKEISFAAVIVGDSDGARIESTLHAPPGRYAVTLSYHGRRTKTEQVVVVSGSRRITIL